MADEAKKAKNIRRSKLGSFTRKKNHITSLLDGGAKGVKLKTEYDELVALYKVLEQAHEDVLVILEEEDLDNEDNFMNAPATVLTEIDLKINTAAETEAQQELEQLNRQKVKDSEDSQKKELESALAIFKASIGSFGKPSANLATLSVERNISFADMRLEISKLENAQNRIVQEKAKVLSIDPSVDISGECGQFDALVVAEVDRCKRIAAEFMKDVPETPAVAVGSPAGSHGSF